MRANNDGPPPEIKLPSLVNASIVASSIVLVSGALYMARDFFLPLVVAVLIYLTLAPLVRFLAHRGIPAVISAVVLVLLVSTGFAAGIQMLSEPVGRIIAEAPRAIDELKRKFYVVRQPVEALVEAGKQVDGLANATSPESAFPVFLAPPGILYRAASTLGGFVTTIGATLILIVFLLSSGDLFAQKLIRIVPTFSDKKRSLRIMRDIEGEVSRYLLTATLINTCLGLAIGFAMALLGMPSPLLWGLGAALLNYIPYVGAIIGIGLASVVAIFTFPTLLQAALPPLAYFLLNSIENWFISPLVLSRRLELNAVAIFVALAFWGWLWGLVGALIAVPLLVVTKVFCDSFNLTAFGEFLSGQAPPGADTGNGTVRHRSEEKEKAVGG